MKVLVTGASGYIGKHVVNQLIKQGYEVIAADLQNRGINSKATFIPIDIFSEINNIEEKIGKIDICIHLAWKDGFVHNSIAHIDNLPLHYHFLEKIINSGCKNIAVMGTMHEVGLWEGKIDEHTPCNPLSLYGIAKNALRQALLSSFSDMDVNIYWLRAYYIFGDDLNNNSIFKKIMIAEKEGKKSFPFTSGQAQYDFLSVMDLSRQIVAASTQTKYTGIINVCSGKAITLGEKVENFIKENGYNIKLEYGAFKERPYDSKIVYGDNSIIKAIMKEQENEYDT